LLQKAKKIVAVELDKRIFGFLQEKYKDNKKVVLINKDILKITDQELREVFQGESYKIVANIPYSITSKLIRVFLEREYGPAEMSLMMQKEVGARIVAKVPNMNILALSCQFFSEPKILFNVSKTCFLPAPKVDSVVVKFAEIKPKKEVDVGLFFQLIKLGFSSKRKKMIKNIASLDKNKKLSEIFEKFGWSENSRAQELALDQWLDLYYEIYKN